MHVSDRHEAQVETGPGRGIDAAFAAAFDHPLVRAIREMVQIVIFQDNVRMHPERYRNDPRARAILARAAIPVRPGRRGTVSNEIRYLGSKKSAPPDSRG